jgi:molybdopterin synthase sulfur carrier subunit
VLTACSFLLDGVAVRDLSTALPDGSGVDVLPPFAGG